MHQKHIVLGVFISILLLSCGSNADSRYDSGYSDGYAVGYNTTCKIRSTLIEGDWDDKNYSLGYQEGYEDGSLACKNKD